MYPLALLQVEVVKTQGDSMVLLDIIDSEGHSTILVPDQSLGSQWTFLGILILIIIGWILLNLLPTRDHVCSVTSNLTNIRT